ncbi:MAG: hypothetical protein AAF694_09380 [Bacteroidota bacterium]
MFLFPHKPIKSLLLALTCIVACTEDDPQEDFDPQKSFTYVFKGRIFDKDTQAYLAKARISATFEREVSSGALADEMGEFEFTVSDTAYRNHFLGQNRSQFSIRELFSKDTFYFRVSWDIPRCAYSSNNPEIPLVKEIFATNFPTDTFEIEFDLVRSTQIDLQVIDTSSATNSNFRRFQHEYKNLGEAQFYQSWYFTNSGGFDTSYYFFCLPIDRPILREITIEEFESEFSTEPLSTQFWTDTLFFEGSEPRRIIQKW